MSMEWIRRTYGVPAKRGARVRFDWPPGETSEGIITSSHGGSLRVRFPNGSNLGEGSLILHPTWNLTYLDGNPDA